MNDIETQGIKKRMRERQTRRRKTKEVGHKKQKDATGGKERCKSNRRKEGKGVCWEGGEKNERYLHRGSQKKDAVEVKKMENAGKSRTQEAEESN